MRGRRPSRARAPLFAGFMQREQLRVSFSRIPCCRGFFPIPIHQQIHLARQARQGRHQNFAGVIFQDQFRDEDRIAQIRKRVVESLARVGAAKRFKVSASRGTNQHSYPVVSVRASRALLRSRSVSLRHDFDPKLLTPVTFQCDVSLNMSCCEVPFLLRSRMTAASTSALEGVGEILNVSWSQSFLSAQISSSAR